MSSLASEMCILNSVFNPETFCCEFSVLIELNTENPFHIALLCILQILINVASSVFYSTCN